MNHLKKIIALLGFLIFLSKAFGTIDHAIIIKSLKIMELKVQILPSSEVT